MKYSTKTFIDRAKEIHGEKYDYSNVNYVNSHTKVNIICPIHGEFLQAPANHINSKQGCPKCGGKVCLTQEEFINRSKDVHGNKYDYSKVNYANMKSKVCIVCPEHGEFWQTPHNHIEGHGCPRCQKNHNTYNTESIKKAFIKVHGNKYDYKNVIYNGGRTKVCIVCPEHGEFYMTPEKHLYGQGCPECGKERRRRNNTKSQEVFLSEARKVHGNKYDYSKVEYVNSNKKVCIICPKHGEFWQTPHHHLSHGCPICSESLLSLFVSRLLDDNNISYEREKTFPWLRNTKNLFLDFYLPEYNIAIECQGRQHFEPIEHFGGVAKFNDVKKRDEKKYELCNKNNIKIVYFTNIDDISKYDIPYPILNKTSELINFLIKEKLNNR